MLSFNVKCAIQVLAELERAKAAGRRYRVTDLKAMCGLEGRGVPVVMSQLRRKCWVEMSGNYYYTIIDLTGASLYDLVLAVDETLCMGHEVAVESWPLRNRDRYTAAMELDENLRSDMERRLKRVLLTDLFACHETTRHKLAANVRRRAAGARIVDGNVVFENRC